MLFLASAAVFVVQERSSVMCTQELGAAHSLHGRTIDGQRSMLGVHSPEVNDNLLRLLHIQREIVVTAPPARRLTSLL